MHKIFRQIIITTTALTTLSLGGAQTAVADDIHYYLNAKGPQSDEAVQAATRRCDSKDQQDYASAKFNACMLRLGFRLASVKRTLYAADANASGTVVHFADIRRKKNAVLTAMTNPFLPLPSPPASRWLTERDFATLYSAAEFTQAFELYFDTTVAISWRLMGPEVEGDVFLKQRMSELARKAGKARRNSMTSDEWSALCRKAGLAAAAARESDLAAEKDDAVLLAP
jgi:hypothetical protein